MAHWLFKTEPDTFSIDDLQARGEEDWDGVRNYQARNFLRDTVAVGDAVLIYHSSCRAVGVAGVAEVVAAGHPDPSQFDPDSAGFDPKSDPAKPRWYQVRVRFVRQLPAVIPLARIKAEPALADIALVQKGNRLSVMPLPAKAFKRILALG